MGIGDEGGTSIAKSGDVSKVRSYKDLRVWRVSMDLVEVSCEIIESLPHPYRFVFCDQLLRASLSIPANIAEDHRRSTKGYLNHLAYALGSQAEVETIIELLRRRHLVKPELADSTSRLCESVGRMLHALVASLERRC